MAEELNQCNEQDRSMGFTALQVWQAANICARVVAERLAGQGKDKA